MNFLDRLKRTVDIWLPSEKQQNVEKGRDFENYVARIFASQGKYFTIEDWTKDIYDKRANINVESNKNPDFIVRYNPTKERFAVECKFRSGLVKSKKIRDNVLNWAYPAQILRYNEYSFKNDIPVFIVIGLGGTPNAPEFSFCVPLKEAQFPEIYPSVLEMHERFPPDKPFFWKNGVLK